MRKWIDLIEGQHSGYSDEEEADEFDMTILGPTGSFEVWHASPIEIKKLRPFSHVGTKEAALHRARDLGLVSSGFLHRIQLIVDKSCEILDSGYSQHDLEGMMSYLETILNLDYDEVEAVLRAPTKAAKLLARYGYDTLWYRNRREDPGSTSWVILQPAKAKIISVERLGPKIE